MRLSLAVLCAALAGCVGGLRSNSEPVQSYVLRPEPMASGNPASSGNPGRPLNASLRVARPLPGPGLESERIVLVQSDRRMSHFSASQWAASLPEVVEAFAIETLRATGDWSVVQDSRSGYAADYSLQINIRRFEADYAGNSATPTVRVVLDCVLGRRSDRKLLASFTAEAAEQVAENRLAAVVAAFEHAAGRAFATVAERAAEAVRTSKVPSPP